MNISLQRTKHEQINEMIDKFEHDDEIYFRQVHRMIDLFETIIKTHTTYLLANYFQVNKVSDTVAKELVQGMRTPSLGTWLRFNDVVFEELAFNHISKEVYETIFAGETEQNQEKLTAIYEAKGNEYIFRPEEELRQVKGRVKFLLRLFNKYKKQYIDDGEAFTNLAIPSFYTYFRDWQIAMSNSIVKFRNDYAHGATPSEEECRKDIEKYLPELEKSLALPWLHETSTVVFHKDLQSLEIGSQIMDIESLQVDKKLEPHIPYLVLPNKTYLRLFPTVTYQPITAENKQSISFFNDLKNFSRQKISYLNYPYAEHIKDDAVFARFTEVFRIEEWRRGLLTEFEDLVLRLQESFKGRTNELAYLRDFVKQKDRGYLYLYGVPGIGKSALVANAFTNPDEKLSVIKYFIRNRKYQHVTEVLDYLNRTLDQVYVQGTRLGYGNSEEEKRAMLHERLRQISPHLVRRNEKLIIMIDGLDEGDRALLNSLPFETYAHILFVYVSRKTPEVTRFINDLPLDYLTMKEIGKIEIKDIRAMLYDVVSKYDIEHEYVEAIAEKSAGHPLYVRLLCEALEQYPEKLNDQHYLPEKWDEFYKRFIDRFIDDEHGQIVLDGLYVFAVARDYLSRDDLQLILDIDSRESLIIFDRLYELLVESIHERNYYQLFHETFHEYLLKHERLNVIKAEGKVINYCLGWEQLEWYGETFMHYPLKHLSTHLRDANRLEELEQLVNDKSFMKKQIEVTNQFTASFTLLESYRQVAYQKQNEEALIAAMIQLKKLNDQMRDNRLSFVENHHHWTLTQWKNHLQNLSYYNNFEIGQALVLNLFSYIEGEGSLLNDLAIEIDQMLPHIQDGFNWVDYVPFPLLVELSSHLFKKEVDPSFIVRRTMLPDEKMMSFLQAYKYDEGSLPVVELFIDAFYKKDLLAWVPTMIQLIEGLDALNLSNYIPTYEAKLIRVVSEAGQEQVNDDILSMLAKYLIRQNKVEQAFSYIVNMINDWKKQKLYRELYEQYKEQQPTISQKAYELGMQIIAHYEGNNRTQLLIDWLTTIMDEADLDEYKQYEEEIDKAMEEDLFSFQFGSLEGLVAHYWYKGKYEQAISVAQRAMDEEVRDRLLLEHYLLSETATHCPTPVKRRLHAEYKRIEKQLFNKNEFELEQYTDVVSLLLTHWVRLGKEAELEGFLQALQSELVYSDIYIPLLTSYYELGQVEQMMKLVVEISQKLQVLRVHHKAVELFLKYDLETELLQLVDRLRGKDERIVIDAAEQALKMNKQVLFQQLVKEVTNQEVFASLTFKQIFVLSMQGKTDEAIALLKKLQTKEGLSDRIIEEVDEAVVQASVNKGNLTSLDALRKQNYRYYDTVKNAIEYHLVRDELDEAYAHYERTFNIIPDLNEFELSRIRHESMLQQIVIKMAKQGDGNVLERLKDSIYASMQLYIEVAVTLNEQGYVKEAEEVIEHCEAKLVDYPLEEGSLKFNFYSVADIYFSLAHYDIEYGNQERAKTYLQHIAYSLAQNSTEGRADRARVYFRLAYEYRKLNVTEQKEYYKEKYKQYLDGNISFVIWSDYVELLIRDHKFTEALTYLDRAAMKSLHYEKIIDELMLLDDLDQLIQIYKRLQGEQFLNESGNPLQGRKMIIRFLFEHNELTIVNELLQSEQVLEERIQLYETLLLVIRPDNLSVFLNYIGNEQESVKQQLEQALLISVVTNPNMTKVNLHEIMANLSLEREVTELALYIYKTFAKEQLDETIAHSLVEDIEQVLQG